MKKPSTLKVVMNLQNAAFEGSSGTEAARILRDVASRIDGEELGVNDCRFLRDVNGNRVGELTTSKR